MKYFFLQLLILLALFGSHVHGQDIMRVHNNNNLIFQHRVDKIDSLKFAKSLSSFYPNTGNFSIPISGIDSITFADNIEGSEIYIIYNDTKTTIINPFADAGVTITDNAGHVMVTSVYPDSGLRYHILGATSNGSLNLTSSQSVKLIMSHATITNLSGAAISVNGTTVSEMVLSAGTVNTLSDASASTASGTLFATGDLTISGKGALNVNGYKKHGILVNASLTIESGIINIAQAASDAIHSKAYIQHGGDITLIATGDGVDAETVDFNDGEISVMSSADDNKGIKSGDYININGGSITVALSGKQSKGISAESDITVNSGIVSVTVSGSTVLEASGNGFDPSYATGIKTDGNVIINGGDISISCPSTNDGGRGISSDGNITVNGGIMRITTAGSGKTYRDESGILDSYSPACLKSDGHILLSGGNITATSTGAAGKGISADSTLTIGLPGASDSLLVIQVSTSGNRFLVSGSGQNADYANAKAIKSEGILTVNSGIINLTTTKEGGEGLESKDKVYIKGGQITANTYDDGINAKNYVEISGGKHSLKASNNDGIDSNGNLTISGGLIISKGAGGFEEGFDCDNNTFMITGGTMVGTGGNTSTPTINVSTQHSLRLSINPNQNICIKNASNEIILIYSLPTLTGGGGFPGGSNKMVVLFSDPAFVKGTYTIQYGGTISGGTNFNGYYTGATYSGGNSKTFTVNSLYTTLNL